MAIFGLKASVNPFGKMSIFRLFELFFYSLERRFFVLEYRKRHVPGLHCKKIKVGKMTIFRPKPWVWKNVNFLTFWTFYLYSLKRRFFVLEYRKRLFPCLHCLKIKVCKMTIFRPKPWVNPFEKMSIFQLFVLLDFIA